MTVEYHDTAVGRLPVGPAADAALAAAAQTRPASPEGRRDGAAETRPAAAQTGPAPAAAAETPARGRTARRLLPALAALVAAAAAAIALWRRSTA